MAGNKEGTGSRYVEISTKDVSNRSTQVNAVDRKSDGILLQAMPIRKVSTSREVDMEAHVIADDVIRTAFSLLQMIQLTLKLQFVMLESTNNCRRRYPGLVYAGGKEQGQSSHMRDIAVYFLMM